ncbi:MAG: hypothetical protein AB1700_17560, partial [Bacillota bacterium]
MGDFEAVVEGDGDAGAPGGLGKLGKLGELGDAEVAFLGPELGAVEGLQLDGAEIPQHPTPAFCPPSPGPIAGKPRPRPLGLLQAPHHVVAHGGLALGGGLVHAHPDHIAGDDGILDDVRVDVRGVWLDVHEH